MLLINETAAKMKVPESLLLSIVGFVLIMAVLSILMLCIYAMSKILKETDGLTVKSLIKKVFGKKEEEVTTVQEEKGLEAPPITASGTAGEIKLHSVEPGVAAMLMAIVADELKTPLNELRFISIKEVGKEESEK